MNGQVHEKRINPLLVVLTILTLACLTVVPWVVGVSVIVGKIL